MVTNRAWRIPVLLPIALGLAWAASPVAAHAPQVVASYRLIEDWPRYPSDMTFEIGTGIAADAQGVIYTISRDVDHWAAHPLAMTRYRGSGTVAKWDKQGQFLGTFADDQEFIGPHSIYVDPSGYVWVADREGHQIVKLTAEGEKVFSLGEYGRFGSDETHFNGPTGVAFLPDGRFVVSDTSYEDYMDVPRDVMAGYTVMAQEIIDQLPHG
ncbi:MAG TPA: hypothetical protein EYQ27_12140, partial [Gemmatimonadetes bacterium]|nr:hypothetical protein [Gemmatimonadota bacterium]